MDNVDHISYGIKNGLAGTALDYMDLEEFDSEHLSALITRINETIERVNPKHFGFIEGLSGVVYVLLKAFRLTNDKRYLDSAESLMNNCDPFINSTHVNNTLYCGRAGLLVVLIDLYSVSPRSSWAERITKTLRILLTEAKFSRTGLYWYHNQTQRRGIVSWGHGSMGIAYALKIASDFFQSPGLKAASDLAVRYALASWNNKLRCWPDFRLDIETKEEDDRLLNVFKRDPSRTLEGRIDLSIENGAAGILVGLNALKKTSAVLESRLRSVLKKLEGHEFERTWTMADGFDVAKKGTAFREFPFEKKEVTISRILTPHFVRTFSALRKANVALGLDFKFPNERPTVQSIVAPLAKRVTKAKDPIAAEGFKLELKKFQLLFDFNGEAVQLYCQKYLSFLENRSLQIQSSKKILSKRYKLNPSCTIVSVKRDVGFGFSLRLNAGNFEVGNYRILLSLSDQQETLSEVNLIDFEELLYYMRKPITGKKLAQAVIEQFGVDEKREKIEEQIVELILSKVQENILIEA